MIPFLGVIQPPVAPVLVIRASILLSFEQRAWRDIGKNKQEAQYWPHPTFDSPLATLARSRTAKGARDHDALSILSAPKLLSISPARECLLGILSIPRLASWVA